MAKRNSKKAEASALPKDMAKRMAKEGHTYEGRMAIHGPSTGKGKRSK